MLPHDICGIKEKKLKYWVSMTCKSMNNTFLNYFNTPSFVNSFLKNLFMKIIVQILCFCFCAHLLFGQTQAGLHVDENHTVLFGQDTTTHGTIKLMWQPSKGALRAGLMNSAWNYNAIGNVSAAFGSSTEARGNYSFATGLGSHANSFAEFSIGRHSLFGGSLTNWELTDAIFEIGNGATSGSQSNLFTVQKSGNVKMGDMTDPNEVIEERLVLDGAIVIGNVLDPTPANGTIRFNGADFQGLAGGSWQSLTSGGGAGSSVWSLNGTHAYYNNGNVGINTNSPTSKLDIRVNGSDGLKIMGDGLGTPYVSINNGGDSHFLLDDINDSNSLVVQSGFNLSFNTRFLGQNNSAMYIKAFENKVGIGTTNPLSHFHINTTIATPSIPAIRYQINGATKYSLTSNGGTVIGTNDPNGAPTNGLYVSGDVVIGTPTQSRAIGFKLSVDGKVMCEELQVELSNSWPDYVFADDYQLLSLSELQKFILKNKHLPGIPAAAKMEEEGIAVGEMQTKLMEKVEELTLYILELHQKIQQLEAKQK